MYTREIVHVYLLYTAVYTLYLNQRGTANSLAGHRQLKSVLNRYLVLDLHVLVLVLVRVSRSAINGRPMSSRGRIRFSQEDREGMRRTRSKSSGRALDQIFNTAVY